MEDLSGTSFSNYVQENIFKPAGMTRSGLDADSNTPDLADSYLNSGGKLENVTARHPLAATPAGGAHSTAADMARFVEALRQGKLLSPERVKMMTTGLVLSDSDTQAQYGLVMVITEHNGIRSFGHAGGFDGTVANTRVFPDSRLAYTLISNISDPPDVPAELLPFLDKIIAERIKGK